MQRFTDTENESWDLSLNAGSICDRILAATEVDLLEPESNAAGVHLLGTSNRKCQLAVWELVSEQASKQGIDSREDFFARITNMTEVREALSREIANFIQSIDRIASIRLEQTKIADERAQVQLEEVLTSQELHDVVDQNVKSEIQSDMEKLREKISLSVAERG